MLNFRLRVLDSNPPSVFFLNESVYREIYKSWIELLTRNPVGVMVGWWSLSQRVASSKPGGENNVFSFFPRASAHHLSSSSPHLILLFSLSNCLLFLIPFSPLPHRILSSSSPLPHLPHPPLILLSSSSLILLILWSSYHVPFSSSLLPLFCLFLSPSFLENNDQNRGNFPGTTWPSGSIEDLQWNVWGSNPSMVVRFISKFLKYLDNGYPDYPEIIVWRISSFINAP